MYIFPAEVNKAKKVLRKPAEIEHLAINLSTAVSGECFCGFVATATPVQILISAPLSLISA